MIDFVYCWSFPHFITCCLTLFLLYPIATPSTTPAYVTPSTTPAYATPSITQSMQRDNWLWERKNCNIFPLTIIVIFLAVVFNWYLWLLLFYLLIGSIQLSSLHLCERLLYLTLPKPLTILASYIFLTDFGLVWLWIFWNFHFWDSFKGMFFMHQFVSIVILSVYNYDDTLTCLD